MNKLSSLTLAQIVNSNHRAAGVFEKFHLDFCCKGKRPLEEACRENQLELDEVLADLEVVMKSNNNIIDFDLMTLTQLADYIVATHHDYVKREMPAIISYLQKVANKHGDRHPEMVRVLEIFSTIKVEMEMHMQKEEIVLFPRIKELEKQYFKGNITGTSMEYIKLPVTAMEHDHDNAGELLAQIRELTNDYAIPANVCTTFRLSLASLQAFELDLHQHVHLENNILFPKALELAAGNASCRLN